MIEEHPAYTYHKLNTNVTSKQALNQAKQPMKRGCTAQQNTSGFSELTKC